MAIKLKSGNGPVLRTPQRSDVKGIVAHDPTSILVSGDSSSREPLMDAVFDIYTGATYYVGGSVSILGEGLFDAEVENLNPDVGTIEDSVITRHSPGIMRLLVKTRLVTIPLNIDLRDKTEEVDQPLVYVGEVEGSLSEHLSLQVDSRLSAGMTLQTHGRVFTTQDHDNKTYVRNPDLWCGDVDLTGISPWNSLGGNTRAGTLITPRHAFYAAHYPLRVGTVVRFVGQDNTVYDRTVLGVSTRSDQDFGLAVLDADLPASVKPVFVAPSDTRDYVYYSFYNKTGGLGFDRYERAQVMDLRAGGGFGRPVDSTREAVWAGVSPGDSGNPGGVIFNGDFVLFSVWLNGLESVAGFPVYEYISDINQMIVDADTQAGVSGVDDPSWPNAGGHYQVKEADFSEFPNYA